jgi:c-di-AMP phosphodiesterase-like protein
MDNRVESQHNPWIIFNNISKPNVLQLIIIGIIIIFIGKVIGWSIIIIVIVLLLGLYLTRSYQQIKQIDPKQEIEVKNKFIQGSNNYFKQAPNLQNIIFKLRNFVYLNKDNFNDLLFNTGNYIKYYNEIMKSTFDLRSGQSEYPDFQQAVMYGKEAVNDLNTMIYSMDAPPDSDLIRRFNTLRKNFKDEISIMNQRMAEQLKIPNTVLTAPDAYNML